MSKKKLSHGGKRSNSGRKKLDTGERKESVWLFIKKGDIELLGGLDVLKPKIYQFVESLKTTSL